MTQMEIIQAFEQLPKIDQLEVAKKIQLQMADELFEELNLELPDMEISSDEIQQEINAFRNSGSR